MNTHAWLAALLALGLHSTASAALQGERIDLGAPEGTPPAPTASDAGPIHPTSAGGPVRRIPIEGASDDVPLPVAARIAAGMDGDRVIEPASGDPFFLGFAAGNYYPPAGEVIDPELAATIATRVEDGRPGEVVYAFVMFSKRITDQREAALAAAGARVIGFHPHHSLRVALSVDAVEVVAALPFVRWVGLQRRWQKVHPMLVRELQESDPNSPLDVWVNVFDSDLCAASTATPTGVAAPLSPAGEEPADSHSALPLRVQSNGWQQARLEAVGVEIRSYDEGLRAFRARLVPSRLEELLALDHVQFVERDRPFESHHDESQPLVQADRGRASWDGGTSGEIVAGIMDSGIERSHLDLNHLYGAGWNLSTSAQGAWDDVATHGTHVAGTVLGDGDVRAGRTGAAPGLGRAADRRLFNVKLLNDSGSGIGVVYQDALNLIGSDYTLAGATTPRPHVVNNSYGTAPWPGSSYFGTEANARAIDNHVYLLNQFMVFSAGNSGSSAGTLGMEGSAKNAFTVGNVAHYETQYGPPGEVWWSSSRGPCGDQRWKPNVAAPGVSIWSTDATNIAGYTKKTGTSMSAPHVTGIAAQLCDHHAFLRYNPPTLASLLMATALTRNGVTLLSPAADGPHLNAYGTGRVDAMRSHDGTAQNALGFWGFYQGAGSHTEIDFNIDPGATRMTVVMNYTEGAASAGASQALVRDIDMYLDRAPFTGAGNTGDYSAHQSARDNSEVRVLTNPAAGAWKIKLWPEYASAFFPPRVGVSVIISYGDTTPDGVLSISADEEFVKPGEPVWVSAAAYNPSDVASAVELRSFSFGLHTLHEVETVLADGVVTDLLDNTSNGRNVMLGNILHGQVRTARWRTSWSTEGVQTFHVDLSSENMLSETDQVMVTVDGTPPGQPTGFGSPTHTVGAHTCDRDITFTWATVPDALSGLAGYSHALSTDPGTIPAELQTLAASETSLSAHPQPTTDPDGWYLHLRAVDRSGNWGDTAHYGPFHIGKASVTSYCATNVNSSGNPAVLSAASGVCLAEGNLTLTTSGLPINKPGIYMTSKNQAFVPLFGGSQGNLCLGGPIVRFGQNPVNSGAAGVMTLAIDFDNLPQGITIQQGETYNFQLWFRDTNPGSTSNTSNGLEITFD
jgi:hypothetical protein